MRGGDDDTVIPDYGELAPEPIELTALTTSINANAWQDGGWDPNLAYACISRYDWDEARQVVAYEREVIAAADRSSRTHEDFEAFLRQAEDEEEWEEGPLDLGVAGLVLVLTCAGFRTSNSCRGHVDFGTPFVRTLTTERHLRFLQARAEESGSVVIPADDKVEIHASTVTRLLALADAILDRQAEADDLGYVEVTGEYVDDW